MVIVALAIAAVASAGMKAQPVSASHLNLEMSPAVAAAQLTAQSSQHRRSRYLLPEPSQPSDDNDGIRFRWKLNKVKMTMPIPSI
jgi:hypothetical protein